MKRVIDMNFEDERKQKKIWYHTEGYRHKTYLFPLDTLRAWEDGDCLPKIGLRHVVVEMIKCDVADLYSARNIEEKHRFFVHLYRIILHTLYMTDFLENDNCCRYNIYKHNFVCTRRREIMRGDYHRTGFVLRRCQERRRGYALRFSRKKNAVAVVTIDRPEALNALNSEVLEALERAVDAVLSDESVG